MRLFLKDADYEAFERIVDKTLDSCPMRICGYILMRNHDHLILRSRPDVVATWDDTEVARRWLRVCPRRKQEDGSPAEPSECELNSIRHDSDRLAEIRRRLSEISWWMRVLCQSIGGNEES